MPHMKTSPEVRTQHLTVFIVNGDKYTGEWQNNKKHGVGTQWWKKAGAMYVGQWKFGKCDGLGIYSVFLPDTKQYAVKYQGGWKNGKKHGWGTYYYSASEFYQGEWVDGQRGGLGIICRNGDVYEGTWLDHKKHGQGVIRYANGNWYEGSWRDDLKNGNGRFYYADKGQMYEGFWVDGVAKCGTMSDFGRNEAPTPTEYPIPKVHLVDMQMVLREAQATYLDQCGKNAEVDKGSQRVPTPQRSDSRKK